MSNPLAEFVMIQARMGIPDAYEAMCQFESRLPSPCQPTLRDDVKWATQNLIEQIVVEMGPYYSIELVALGAPTE